MNGFAGEGTHTHRNRKKKKEEEQKRGGAEGRDEGRSVKGKRRGERERSGCSGNENCKKTNLDAPLFHPFFPHLPLNPASHVLLNLNAYKYAGDQGGREREGPR